MKNYYIIGLYNHLLNGGFITCDEHFKKPHRTVYYLGDYYKHLTRVFVDEPYDYTGQFLPGPSIETFKVFVQGISFTEENKPSWYIHEPSGDTLLLVHKFNQSRKYSVCVKCLRASM